MNSSMPGLPVHHQLPESTQTHVHRGGDAIHPSHPLLSPSPPVLNLSQHQGLFKWVSSSYQVAKDWSFSEHPGLISFRMDWLDLHAVQAKSSLIFPTTSYLFQKQFPLTLFHDLTFTSASLTPLKPLTVWITTNCGKLLKRWEYQTTLFASCKTSMQVKKQQLELDREKWTGSKFGKEFIKPVYCHPAY